MTEKKLKRLPLGISTFSEIIQDNYVYVDKTHDIYNMVIGGKYYFLSRPRRFGKSLLVSTLAELFLGNKELFKDLWIAGSDYAWPQHPVLRFDFSTIGHATAKKLTINLDVRLKKIARDYAIDLTNFPTVDSKFQEIITQLAQRNKVVILIDEYDKPILDHIDNSTEAKAQREVLKNFYSVIKGSDQYVRFVLLTGVSKFAKTSVFSGINNLEDITLDEEYATILGYTKHELTFFFEKHIEIVAQKLNKTATYVIDELESYYDGYRFAPQATAVFNPYSVLSSLRKKAFANYWFATGTPTFLITLLQKHDYRPEALVSPVLNAGSLESFEPDDIPLSSLLFQTGYLTIKDYDTQTDNYTLGIPNREVAQAFNLLIGINFDAHASILLHENVQTLSTTIHYPHHSICI